LTPDTATKALASRFNRAPLVAARHIELLPLYSQNQCLSTQFIREDWSILFNVQAEFKSNAGKSVLDLSACSLALPLARLAKLGFIWQERLKEKTVTPASNGNEDFRAGRSGHRQKRFGTRAGQP
jgi:hypothetical protein